MVEFGDELEITYVMGGLAREFEEDLSSLVIEWLDHAAESGMPFDPRVWHHDGVRSTYPACIAFRAAAEQGPDAASRYLRVLREGFMCHGRKLDGPEALVAEARRAGLDSQRFRIDLESNAILEAFGSDLEETRTIPDAAREAGLATEGSHGSNVERLAFPALRFDPGRGRRRGALGGRRPFLRRVARGGDRSGRGALDAPRPDVAAALQRFGSMATAELEAVCDLPGPRAGAEVWRLASEWRARRVPVLNSELWEPVR